MADDLAEYIDGFPLVSGRERKLGSIIAERDPLVFLPTSPVDFNAIESAFAIALHMHQPLIPGDVSGGDRAGLICNLQDMMQHPEIGDNRKASRFRGCYRRPGELIPELYDAGYHPRMMLDYSGALLHGFRQMGLDDVMDSLYRVTTDARYRECVEWLGAPWGHAVAPSTPVQDYRLHVKAFQQHFAAIFGSDALARIRGFSPAEMALPNHPDVAYAFVQTLKECGYEWVLLQQQTLEGLNGQPLSNPHVPYRLECRNADGDRVSMIAIVKPGRSDCRLVARMHNHAEARGLRPVDIDGRPIPPLVTQIADGENGEPMMAEFPDSFRRAVKQATHSRTPMMNVTEYLENLKARGYTEAHFQPVQPWRQAKLWERAEPGCGSAKLNQVIRELKREDSSFELDGGSWTREISWVRGYRNVLEPMDRASALFAERILQPGIDPDHPGFRQALFHLMTAQTSCYRYWGQGRWTDYGRELSRRTIRVIQQHFPDVLDGSV